MQMSVYNAPTKTCFQSVATHQASDFLAHSASCARNFLQMASQFVRIKQERLTTRSHCSFQTDSRAKTSPSSQQQQQQQQCNLHYPETLMRVNAQLVQSEQSFSVRLEFL